MLNTVLLNAALAYAAAGIAVFPCHQNAKTPACAHGHKDATTDVAIIQQWWAENPLYNIGIDPASAGWTVIDADLYKPGAKEELARVFPEGIQTYAVRTPRGGTHYYFEGSLPTSASRLGPGIDTRGSGTGYVLAPPSIIDGASYAVISDTDISPLPPGIDGRKTNPATNSAAHTHETADAGQLARARAFLRDCVSRGDVAIEGQGGDERTYALFAQLRDLGIDQGSALDLAENLWNPVCIPPWETDELILKAENAFKYSQNAAGVWDVAPAADVFATSSKGALGPQSDGKRSRFHPEDDDDMDKEPDGKWLVPGVIPDRATVLMYGPTGSYKSFLALDLALGIATGRKTFGQEPEQGCVFYGALEGAPDIKRARRPAWRLARGVTNKTPFYVMPAPRVHSLQEMEDFAEQIQLTLKDRECKLVVLDTASKMMVGSDATKDVPRLVAFCEGLVMRFGCSVVVVHHTGRDATKGPRDSSAYEADFDSVIRVTSPTRHVVTAHIEKHKWADAPEQPFTFQGHKIAKSLVFEPTTEAEHAKLTQDDEMFSKKTVGEALKAIGAKGKANGVTTDALLTEMLPHEAGNKVALERAKKALKGLIEKKLAMYCSGEGKALIWHLGE
jgi:hypothetical protein